MPSLVITNDTVTVNLESRHLELVKRAEGDSENRLIKLRAPLYDIDRVVVCGRPCISMAVFQKFMRDGIPVFFVTSHGRWIGSLCSDNNMNAERRIRQYQLSSDRIFSLEIARKIVFAKIKNSRRVLQRLSANRKLSDEQEQIVTSDRLDSMAEKAASAENIEELRGYEGMASALYFARLSSFFPDDLPFKERSRRPPRDEANALMSWTYTILLGEIDGAVRSHGLDPCIGFLHEISHGRPSMSLDLLEPLRAPLCDMLVLHLFNHQIFKKEDFEFNSEDGGTYMKQDGRKEFFREYEMTMTRKFSPKKGDSHVDFRKVIENSVLAVLKAMEGKTDYEFFLMP